MTEFEISSKSEKEFRFKKFSFALPITLLLFTLFFGFLLSRFLEGIGSRYLREQSENTIQVLAAGIQNEMQFVRAGVSAMSNSPWVFPALLDQSPENIKRANSVLDRYNSKLGFSVCYLLDTQGTAIASSNRDTPESYSGKNYEFTPYFQKALQGQLSFHMTKEDANWERSFYAAHPIEDEQGKVIGVAVIKKDIEEAKNVLWAYPNSFYVSPNGVVFISGLREMVFRTLWPLSEERIRAIKEAEQFDVLSFEPVFPQPLKNRMKVKFRGESYRVFQKFLGPEGWSLIILQSRRSVFYFALLGWIITAFAILIILILTAWVFLRLKEEELLAASELRYRTLSKELERLNKLKDDFVSIVAHELRNPLAMIRESAALILDGVLGEVSEEQKKYIEITKRTGDRLIHITTDLLDLAKIESGKLVINFELVDLLSLIKQSCEGITLRANKKGVEILEDFPDGKLEIFADFDKISQVVMNLLSNALKFTEKGSITTEVKDLGEEVRCAVKDTGPGISPENLSRLFSKFEQFGKPTTSAEKGSGLGLVISKNIIEAHGGKIWAESKLGEGSSFVFTLPKKQKEK